MRFDRFAERLGVIAFIAKDMFGWQAIDERFGLGEVACLTRCENEAQGIAQRIDNRVDLGGQPAARAADRTSFSPPFLPAAC